MGSMVEATSTEASRAVRGRFIEVLPLVSVSITFRSGEVALRLLVSAAGDVVLILEW